jgi:hypothetical protein
MLQGHDHTIFLVADPSDLDTVARRFADAGFLITERDDAGKESATTAQKLICFADGSYVEILTIRDAAARAKHRFVNLLPLGDGWADYSLVTSDLDADRARLAAAGMPLSPLHDHTKTLRDGRPWGVRLILAGIGAGGAPALPFLVQDTVGRELRIPRARTAHPNGVTGTAGVTVAVHSLAAVEPQFVTLFGKGELHDGRALRFKMSAQWVDLVEAAATRRGEGMISVTFLNPGIGALRALDLGLGDAATSFIAGA